MRWTLSDPATGESWTMPINPDRMTSPHPAKNLDFAKGFRPGIDRTRTFMSPPSIVEWTWEGVIRSQAHHDALVEWAAKGEVHVTDHLGRTWAVVMKGFAPVDRSPTPSVGWRLRYAMKTLILRQVA